MKFRMFHIPKPKKFSYTPIYYTPDEQERTDREGKAKSTGNLDERQNKYWADDFNVKNRRKSINITMYLVIALLLLYFIFFTS